MNIYVSYRNFEFEVVNPCLHITQLQVYCPLHPLWESMKYDKDDKYHCTAHPVTGAKREECTKKIPLNTILAELKRYHLELKRNETPE